MSRSAIHLDPEETVFDRLFAKYDMKAPEQFEEDEDLDLMLADAENDIDVPPSRFELMQ